MADDAGIKDCKKARSKNARSKKASAAPKEAVAYAAGEKVSHSIFGEGVIVSVTPMSNDSMLDIAFDKVGTKKIMANYAKLKKL